MDVSRNKLIIGMFTFLDICLTVAAFVGSYFIKKYLLPYPYRGLSTTPDYYIILLMVIIVWFINFRIFNVYLDFTEQKFNKILIDVIKAVSFGIVIIFTFLFLFKMEEISRLMIGIFYISNLFLLIVSKRVIYLILFYSRFKKYNIKNILIIGSKDRARDAINTINTYAKGYALLGCLEIDEADVGKVVNENIRVIGTIDDLKSIILTHVVDEVIFAMPLKKIESVDIYMLLIEMIGIKVRVFPDWHIHSILYKPGIASIAFDSFHGIPTMVLSTTTTKHRDLLIKLMFDYIFAGVVLLLLIPLFLFIACAIKLFSWGPIFFKQERVGINGRQFVLYKFRTMVLDAESKLEELKAKNEADGPVFKIKNDPRIIPFIGTILRKTSLDELPQLINILTGEMSFVGPRPPIQHEVDEYDLWQRRRLTMKPGLTCLWQIAPMRNDISFHDWMNLDLEYIDKWSLKLDFQILLKTVRAVIAGAGR
ncbi:MAG: sugar transferase [Spirochaetota bacterium]|nr:sugar transferase [Spirochaetota bacterium]